jgi:pimeloyl-ACP methyl ester carboxylesterase
MKILDDVTIPIGQVTLPTMVIWGNRDVAVTRMAVERGREYVAGPHEFVELDAGHWLVQEKPDVVIGCIRRQLRRYPLVDSSHVAPTRADQATEPIG